MNPRLVIAAAVLAACAPFSLAARSAHRPQQPAPEVLSHAQPNQKVYPLNQIIPATVHQAWVLSGKNEEAFFDIVQQLAELSAENRGLTLPNSADAGKRMGEIIKEKAKADHDQLLYVIVDEAVRAVGKPSPDTKK